MKKIYINVCFQDSILTGIFSGKTPFLIFIHYKQLKKNDSYVEKLAGGYILYGALYFAKIQFTENDYRNLIGNTVV